MIYLLIRKNLFHVFVSFVNIFRPLLKHLKKPDDFCFKFEGENVFRYDYPLNEHWIVKC